VPDFVNLKIKLNQSFRVTHRGKMCVYVFIRVDAHTCMSIYIYTMFKKDNKKKENTFFLCLEIRFTCEQSGTSAHLRQKRTHEHRKIKSGRAGRAAARPPARPPARLRPNDQAAGLRPCAPEAGARRRLRLPLKRILS
jgi:hypothetical protein